MHQETKKKERPSPINILYQDPKDMTKLLQMNLKNMSNFYIKRINNGKHVLHVDRISNFNNAKELLTKCNTRFYTYTTKTEKPIILLLKGLNCSYTEVLSELISLNIENIEFKKVSRFTTNKSRQENKILLIFLVQLMPQSELNNLKKIKYLFHQLINWDKLMRREIIQYKKCQRIGHAASNCNLLYRCVKCNDKHEPGKYSYEPQIQLDKSKLFCINCNKYGHPASYRGCPKIIENKNRLTTLNTNNTNRIVNKTNPHINKSLIKPGLSFADMTKTSIQRNTKPTSQINNARSHTHINTTDNISTNAIITEIKNMARLEKIVENNSTKINSIASIIE